MNYTLTMEGNTLLLEWGANSKNVKFWAQNSLTGQNQFVVKIRKVNEDCICLI